MPSPYDETYDRRHLVRRAHRIELRDRSLLDVQNPKRTYDLPEVRYNNRLIVAYTACRANFRCWHELTTKAGFNEPGVDVFVGPAAIGQAQFVSVVPLKKEDGPHVCDNCGSTIPEEDY